MSELTGSSGLSGLSGSAASPSGLTASAHEPGPPPPAAGVDSGPAHGNRLYVYYRVPAPLLASTLAQARRLQQGLREAHPRLQAELLRRPGAPLGEVTVMETYALRADDRGASCASSTSRASGAAAPVPSTPGAPDAPNVGGPSAENEPSIAMGSGAWAGLGAALGPAFEAELSAAAAAAGLPQPRHGEWFSLL